MTGEVSTFGILSMTVLMSLLLTFRTKHAIWYMQKPLNFSQSSILKCFQNPTYGQKVFRLQNQIAIASHSISFHPRYGINSNKFSPHTMSIIVLFFLCIDLILSYFFMKATKCLRNWFRKWFIKNLLLKGLCRMPSYWFLLRQNCLCATWVSYCSLMSCNTIAFSHFNPYATKTLGWSFCRISKQILSVGCI